MDLSNSIMSLPIQTQYFPFFPTSMKYILQNSSPKLLLKLYQSCKYFYFKLKTIIAPNVWYHNYPEKKEIQCVLFGKNRKSFCYRVYTNIEKLWLCDTLVINSGAYAYAYEILSESSNLIKVELQTNIRNENGETIPIEEIMILFQNLKKFEICPPHFTMESFQKLSYFKFSNKFQRLRFGMIKTEFDPISLCKFLKENIDNDTEFDLAFHWDFPQLKNQLLPRVKEIINGWEKNKPKKFFL